MKYLLILATLVTASAVFARDRNEEKETAKETVRGLICDQETPDGREGKTKVEITVKGSNAVLLFRNAFSISASGRMTVEARGVEPILANDLAKLNKQVLVDRKGGSEIAFKVDGYTFDQKPRLGATVKLGDDEPFKLTSCLAEISRPYNPF